MAGGVTLPSDPQTRLNDPDQLHPQFRKALAALLERAGARAVFAAGGVRGEDDLARLRAIGVAGVLVATALHDGRLSAAAVARFHR